MSVNDTQTLVSRLWSYCDTLRDDGLSYSDYVEQLTCLLFLKMAHEFTQPPYNRSSIVPENLSWPSLLRDEGLALDWKYREVLVGLGNESGTLGLVFRKAQNRIQDPAKLRRLIDAMDSEQWTSLDADVKGDLYEGLLQKNAEDVKSGAGQYFTPRQLIRAIVEVMCPGPEDSIHDPACGTGGFLLAAHRFISQKHLLDPDQIRHLQNRLLSGVELVDNTARICVMNLLLHGIGRPDGNSLIDVADALAKDSGSRHTLVLTNPPFGRKSSVTVVGAGGSSARESLTIERQDFWATTSNKQLNFIQHVHTQLDINGRAAMVVPDNVLFEGGAGEIIRRHLLHSCDVHTLLRLPTGIFYRPGVKANVLFFDRKAASPEPCTQELWIYDLRTNQRFTLKQRPLTYHHLEDFISAFSPGNRQARIESERFHRFSYEDLVSRDQLSLDIFWLRDTTFEDIDNLPSPEDLAAEIAEDIETALGQFTEIATTLSDRTEPS